VKGTITIRVDFKKKVSKESAITFNSQIFGPSFPQKRIINGENVKIAQKGVWFGQKRM
jgi:hypothetical protein